MSPVERLSYGPFHVVRIYRPQPPVEHLALLLSGDGGWGPPLDAIASRLSAQGTLVAGVDVRDLFSSFERNLPHCVSPSTDLADLAHQLRQRYALPLRPPVLIGYSAGATLVYVALAAAPCGTFAGGLTLSFCADLDLSMPLCATPALRSVPRSTGVRLLPAPALPAPWTALHGLDDTECPAAEAREFTSAVSGTHFNGVPRHYPPLPPREPLVAGIRGGLARGERAGLRCGCALNVATRSALI
jgi:type IV secretory pathway VirJ component